MPSLLVYISVQILMKGLSTSRCHLVVVLIRGRYAGIVTARRCIRAKRSALASTSMPKGAKNRWADVSRLQPFPDPHQSLAEQISPPFILLPLGMVSVKANAPDPIIRAGFYDYAPTRA